MCSAPSTCRMRCRRSSPVESLGDAWPWSARWLANSSGSNSGIGYVLQRSIGTFDLPTMFAALVILALLGVVLFWIVDRIERLVIPWHVSQREDFIFAA